MTRKKISFMLLVVSMLILTSAAHADDKAYLNDSGYILLDILVYRPVALVGTVAGTAVFVGISPLTALAQIAPPHDAFQKTADILIGIPAYNAFSRPVGELDILDN